jgi:hypothetical protein
MEEVVGQERLGGLLRHCRRSRKSLAAVGSESHVHVRIKRELR